MIPKDEENKLLSVFSLSKKELLFFVCFFNLKQTTETEQQLVTFPLQAEGGEVGLKVTYQ